MALLMPFLPTELSGWPTEQIKKKGTTLQCIHILCRTVIDHVHESKPCDCTDILPDVRAMGSDRKSARLGRLRLNDELN